jgi:hypothetical protein
VTIVARVERNARYPGSAVARDKRSESREQLALGIDRNMALWKYGFP